MKSDILVYDVCECLMIDKANDKKYFFGLTSKSDVNQKIKQEFLKAGIGMRTIGVIQSDKEIDFTVDTTLHNDQIFAIQSGDDIVTKLVTVNRVEDSIEVTEQDSVILEDVPKDGTKIIVIKEDNTELECSEYDSATKKVTATGVSVGEFVKAIYEVQETAEVLPLDATKFPKSYKVELHTIAYNPETETVVGDIYWVFSKCLPNGEIKAGYEGGKSNGDSMKFTAMLPKNQTQYGQYIYIKR